MIWLMSRQISGEIFGAHKVTDDRRFDKWTFRNLAALPNLQAKLLSPVPHTKSYMSATLLVLNAVRQPFHALLVPF